jgi:tetratricopeptide (TPR) repeat protein
MEARMRRLAALALASMLVAGACGEVQALLGRLVGGLPGDHGGPATPAPTEGVDQVALAAALQRLAADPRDTHALMEIADIYYAVNDFESASTWLDKLLAIEPANVSALLARGATAFNLGDNATAEIRWKQVVALDPENIEAHYDLGLLYVTVDPPDLASARREWTIVISLDPTSQLAATVRAHLAALGEPTVSPTP